MRSKPLVIILLSLQSLWCQTSMAQKQFKALLVTTTRGWHHESQHAGVLAVQQLGMRNFFDGGRSFYTALGHLPVIFSDPTYLQHLTAGIIWAATGKK
jgi:type 1 glutamine amidotransferase